MGCARDAPQRTGPGTTRLTTAAVGSYAGACSLPEQRSYQPVVGSTGGARPRLAPLYGGLRRGYPMSRTGSIKRCRPALQPRYITARLDPVHRQRARAMAHHDVVARLQRRLTDLGGQRLERKTRAMLPGEVA